MNFIMFRRHTYGSGATDVYYTPLTHTSCAGNPYLATIIPVRNIVAKLVLGMKISTGGCPQKLTDKYPQLARWSILLNVKRNVPLARAYIH